MESTRSQSELLRRITDLDARLAISGTTEPDVRELLRRIEEAIREGEEHLTRAEFLAQSGNWSADLATNRLAWSKGVFRIFGKSDDFEPTFEGWLAEAVPDDVARIREWCAKCVTEKRPYPIEFQFTRSDGEVRTVASTAEILLGNDGLPVRIFGVIQDVTDSKRAQQKLLASQKLESIGTLANGIAHDFNNLLASVLAETELGLDALAGGSSPTRELKSIYSIAHRGVDIVRQLMSYSGKDSGDAGPVNVSGVVADMSQLLTLSVSKHVLLETDLSPDIPPVRCSAAQIAQIVMNLVINASEAIGDEDGVVRISTTEVNVAPDGSAPVPRSLPRCPHIQLKVIDTGSGMARETQTKMFDPFFTKKAAGRGLGLAVVDGIVRAAGGSISVESEVGRGTTVRITLPCAKSPTEQLVDPGDRNDELLQRSSRNASVLVVEDEHALREAIAKVLRKTGITVLEASDGWSAVEIIRDADRDVEVILLDLTIPGNSSENVLAEAERLRPTSKVLLTSAYGEQHAGEKLTGPQVRGFLRKPFGLRDLVESIRNALD